MNKRMKQQIHDDYREILTSEAGKRMLGGIFFMGRLNGVGLSTDYSQGMRDLTVRIANTIYEVNPYGVADCMKAYEEFMREYVDDGRPSDTDYAD